MNALNKIVGNFTKTITKLENLAEVNQQKAGIAGDEIQLLVNKKTSLEKEEQQARIIAGRLRELLEG